MQPNVIEPVHASKAKQWSVWILSGLAIVFLLFDSVIHVLVVPPVVEAMNHLGYPVDLALSLGITELVCLALYVIPRTSVLGAILLTGYLGGAVATQLRIAAPLFSTALFPVYVGILIWVGLFLREHRLHSILPLRRNEQP